MNEQPDLIIGNFANKNTEMNNDFESLMTLNTSNLLSEFGTELLNEASTY